MRYYRQAIELDPTMVAAYKNLGAMALRAGDIETAEAAYREAVRLMPDSADAWVGLGCVLDDRKSADTEATLRRALALDAHNVGGILRLTHWLLKHGRASEALDTLNEELAVGPENAELLRLQAKIYADVGNVSLAYAVYRRLLELAPSNWDIWSEMLSTLNFISDGDADTVFAEHRRFGQAIAQALGAPKLTFPQRTRQRLKLGYVSADFRIHAMASFIESVLRHHDRERFEVHCFYNYKTADEFTRRLAANIDSWHDIAELDDETVAQQVYDNGIDILIDLSGHTMGNRLGVFARKPAPLQFTWLGYLCTTGLTTMDFRICDAYTDPLEVVERPDAESLARLPHSQWCYQPQVELLPPSTLPMLKNGYLTLGSFNHEIKLNSSVIRAWVDLLRAVPKSRLRIIGVTSDVLEQRIRNACSLQGVSSERIEICGRVEIDRYFALYREVDIALDTFPFNGGTTTCDALIMGVPVVTVAGNRALARGGVSLLSNVGLTEWIADSPQTIVDVVKARMADPQGLAQLRAELPARMRASPLMDGPRFTRDLEALYLRAWEQHSN